MTAGVTTDPVQNFMAGLLSYKLKNTASAKETSRLYSSLKVHEHEGTFFSHSREQSSFYRLVDPKIQNVDRYINVSMGLAKESSKKIIRQLDHSFVKMTIVRDQEASSSTSVYAYELFLSFRGDDTRKNFTDHLYTALVQLRYRTFRDNNEIERGESLRPKLDKAIKESRISIIVFSEKYASSSWCLDELVMILKCSTLQHAVLPVYYDVRPSEIWKPMGRTGEAFDGYVKQYEAEIDYGKKMRLRKKVKQWKEALEEVADLAGMDLKNQADG
ncbi:hypothetical protein LguiB_020928 [Lonicera macranthoides]